MATFKDLFAQMLRDTSNTHLSADHDGYQNIINRGHWTDSWLLSGDEPGAAMHMGHTLEATLYAKKVSTVQRHGGGKLRVDYVNAQPGTPIESGFSVQVNHIGWNDDEVSGNKFSEMTEKAVRARFENIIEGKEQNMNQDCLDEREDGLWLPADQVAMEAGNLAKSIPYYLTENASGRATDVVTGSDITNVNGATIAAAPTYTNVRRTYAATGGAAGDADDLLGALLGAMRRCHHESLPQGRNYADKESLPNVIFCSNNGMDYAQAIFRKDPTVWSTREESALGFKIGGVMIRNIDALDTAALYDDGAGGLADENGADITGPRFYGINRKFLCSKFEQGEYMLRGEPTNLTASNYPFDNVQVVKTKHQLWGTDLRKHFVVSPSVDV